MPEHSAGLVSLNPIYDFLRARGCAENQEHVVIAGTPVQFIVAFNPLIEAAVTAATNKTFKQVNIRVFQLEHLMAIMLHTGRPKDFTRLAQVLADTPYDKAQFDEILQQHRLQAAWQKFQSRFL